MRRFLQIIFFGFIAILYSLNLSAQTTITVTGPLASGNYYVNFPCDVSTIKVEVWGGGGGGGGDNTNPATKGGGGGGGGYSMRNITVTGGTYLFTMAVGGGGAAGAAGGGTGGNGGNTTFTDGTWTLTANGGRGGIGTGGAGGAGGTATGGTTNTTGTAGVSGATTGAGGASPNGGAGGAAAANNNPGNPGIVPGGGGSGGNRIAAPNRAGGGGAAGRLVITYTTSLPNYCSPTVTVAIEPITNVTFAGINNTTPNTSGIDHEQFCLTANVAQGGTYPIALQGNTVCPYTN
ncbi:MAG TPA: hypothetical protein PKD97_10525, partial [Ferruginibacter sp.]|nr:hypothetical protein [Ferruginibacter sp.]